MCLFSMWFCGWPCVCILLCGDVRMPSVVCRVVVLSSAMMFGVYGFVVCVCIICLCFWA